MKAADVVNQMAVLLPQLSDRYTTNVAVRSVTRFGASVVVNVTCDDEHGLEPGNAVALAGADTQIVIGTLTRSGVVGTLVTDTDHDLTNPIAPTIEITGATEPEFNGTFTLINVDNRRTIRFEMPDAGPTAATGSPVLVNAESQLRQWNGTYLVESIVTPTIFTITQPDLTLLDPVGTITARGKPRISAGVNPARLQQAYTEKKTDELWAFVVLEDVTASKSRNIRSDAIDNLTPNNFFRQQVIQPLTIYLFVPAQLQLGAADARDLAEEEFRNLSRCLLDSAFDSNTHVGKQGTMQFVTHGVFDYNTAVYIHAYSYQQVIDLYEEDGVGPDLDVAFRNITHTSFPQVPEAQPADAGSLVATLDLDDTPL